ncbi:ankyrin repeat-containing protein At5g02620-like [Arachis stenosperma]|uniref:ankyrin repeat-containing protein At5g02620-like n=1 Tax=Arachis stenosperma TaxID=217475 RepID=UPI0025AC952A|nr:ankyrin repeat-containing protein At5g02620-like [Arachis stenosperma]
MSVTGKKMTKQLTGKRDDTHLHSAARSGSLSVLRETLSGIEDQEELHELLARQNQDGETPLYVAAEYGYVDLVRELIQLYDLADAGIKARNGFDALHIAAKQGDLDIVKILMEAHPELSMTVDQSNTTALHTAATQGHVEIVKLLLEAGKGLATIAKSNGKTALHSAARNGHVAVVKVLLEQDREIATRIDKKRQTALHMAVKGQNLEVVEELIKGDPSTINFVDNKGNTPLHIASRKGRAQIVKKLLEQKETNKKVVNRSGETALDTAEKMGNHDVKNILLEHGVVNANALVKSHGITATTTTTATTATTSARELKQTVSDIKHEVHNQLEHTRQTRKRVQGIAKRINKMHQEGLNNAINSTTVVAVLIATVAFAAIFTVPGQFVDDPNDVPEGSTLGEANIAPQGAFLIFFVFDSIALFISLAVVVVQTSVVVIESKAKKQMMAIINKLMWLACVLITVSFLALAFVVVGKQEMWLAISVTVIGTTIMVTTLGTMCYWVIKHRIQASNLKNIRRSSMDTNKTKSSSVTAYSDSELLNRMYAI